MTKRSSNRIAPSSRRSFLKAAGAGSLASVGLAGCLGGSGGDTSPTEDDPLKVAVYGGVFQDVLDDALINPFQEETGIPTESRAQAVGEALVKLKNSVDAGEAPIDVVLVAPVARIKAQDMGVWLNYSPDELSNLGVMEDQYVNQTDDGQMVGVGGFAWFLNLVSYEPAVDEPLDTWSALWDSQYENGIGVNRLPDDSFLLNIACELFDEFDEQEHLNSEEGIDKVLEKVAEVKPQVGLWWAEEAEAQQALKEGEVMATQMYNDVSLVMKEGGAPIQIEWPKEGAMGNYGSWTIVKTSEYAEEAKEFVDYSITPEVQNSITEQLYTAPTIKESELDISSEMYEKVYGPGPDAANVPYQEGPYIEYQEYLTEQWNQILLE